jgi:hypothetical protein
MGTEISILADPGATVIVWELLLIRPSPATAVIANVKLICCVVTAESVTRKMA